MDQFTWAAKNIDNINPAACRQWAAANFSLERIAPMYEEYFESVLNTRDRATDWNADNPERGNLDWMKREWPAEVSADGK